MAKVVIQTQSDKIRTSRPNIASTVQPSSRPSYNEWQEEIRSELHTSAPSHRQPLKWHLNTIRDGK